MRPVRIELIAAILEKMSRSQGDIWHQSNQCSHCHILPDITVFHPGPYIINTPCKVLKRSWTLYSFHKTLTWQHKPWPANEVTGSQWRHTLCKCCPKPDLCHYFLVTSKWEWPGPGLDLDCIPTVNHNVKEAACQASLHTVNHAFTLIISIHSFINLSNYKLLFHYALAIMTSEAYFLLIYGS